MIPVMLRDMLARLWIVVLIGLLFFSRDPAFHTHEEPGPELGAELGPLGLSAPMSYLAAAAMIVLLVGFISTDRRDGYTRIFFSHPTSPLAFYALRWGIAYVLALLVTALFFLASQWVGWGVFLGGWAGLILPAVSALIFGGLMAFLSTALPRGDAWVAAALFVPTLIPQLLIPAQLLLPSALYGTLLFLLPPQTTAMQQLYAALLDGQVAWGAAAFAAGYGVFWLVLAGVLLRVREWP